MEGVTWIAQEESLALPPFPRFSSSNNCRISTPFRWVFNLDPGKWLDMKEATIQLIQAVGWRSHCDKCRSLFAWAEPCPYMESEVLSATKQCHCHFSAITPSTTDKYWLYSKAWKSDSCAFGSRRFWLTQATLNLKHCIIRRAKWCCLHYKWCSIEFSSKSKCFYCL